MAAFGRWVGYCAWWGTEMEKNGKLLTKQHKNKSKTQYFKKQTRHATKCTNSLKHLVTTCPAHQWPGCARRLGGKCVKLTGHSVELWDTHQVTRTKIQTERWRIINVLGDSEAHWRAKITNITYIYDLSVSVLPLRILTRVHPRTHILLAFAYTQSQIRRLNCYHMVTIVKAANRGKTAQTSEK